MKLTKTEHEALSIAVRKGSVDLHPQASDLKDKSPTALARVRNTLTRLNLTKPHPFAKGCFVPTIRGRLVNWCINSRICKLFK